MRERGSGVIVNVSSIAGLVARPFGGAYSASKHALEAISEALHHELRPFGIRVAVVEPGQFETALLANARRRPASTSRRRTGSPRSASTRRCASSCPTGGGPRRGRRRDDRRRRLRPRCRPPPPRRRRRRAGHVGPRSGDFEHFDATMRARSTGTASGGARLNRRRPADRGRVDAGADQAEADDSSGQAEEREEPEGRPRDRGRSSRR